MKLRKLYIENYKIFKDFNLNFIDKDNKSLDIVILAGINGSGKTTILNYIFNFYNNINDWVNMNDWLEVELNNKIKTFNLESKKYKLKIDKDMQKQLEAQQVAVTYSHEDSPSVDDIIKHIEYLSVDNNIEDIKFFLPAYIEKKIYEKDVKASEVYQKVREDINILFKSLDVGIEFDSRDGEGNLFFKNKKGEKFSIDDISTGEKTLLSKVLYLYLSDIKDKVILIDEPELSLHPSWQNKVLKLYENFAKNNNCQIIIATHSPHIIGSAKPRAITF